PAPTRTISRGAAAEAVAWFHIDFVAPAGYHGTGDQGDTCGQRTRARIDMNAMARVEMGASWYAQHAEAFERPQLTYDIDVDVCVIGAGLAGLTVAREVARRGWSVAVLEARRVAASASGRNCGFVLPGLGADVRQMVARVGIDRARELWQLSAAGVEYVRTTIRETEMPGTEPVSGWLDVSKVDSGDEMLAVLTLLEEFGATIEGWPAERVRAALKSESYFHAIHH